MTDEQTSRRIEIYAGLIMFTLGIAGFFAVPYMVSTWAFAMPGLTSSSLSPTFFPCTAMLAIAVAGLGVVVSTRQRSGLIPVVTMTREEWRRALIAGGIVIAYALLIPLFGFVVSSVLFIGGLAATAGYRRWVIIIPTALLFPIITMLVFRWGLKVLLPSGTIM